MVIRTAILCVPALDEEALSQIRSLLREYLPQAIVLEEKSAQSQRHWIAELLRQWSDEEEMDLILSIGGTMPAPGPSSSEIVPEATGEVIERFMPGLSESMRAYAMEQTELAVLDRGTTGIRGRTLIVNLPAGAAAARLFLDGVITMIQPILAHLQSLPDAPQIGDRLEIVATENDDRLHNTKEAAPQRVEPTDRILLDEAPNENRKTGQTSQNTKRLDPAEFATFLQQRKTTD